MDHRKPLTEEEMDTDDVISKPENYAAASEQNERYQIRTIIKESIYKYCERFISQQNVDLKLKTTNFTVQTLVGLFFHYIYNFIYMPRSKL